MNPSYTTPPSRTVKTVVSLTRTSDCRSDRSHADAPSGRTPGVLRAPSEPPPQHCSTSLDPPSPISPKGCPDTPPNTPRTAPRMCRTATLAVGSVESEIAHRERLGAGVIRGHAPQLRSGEDIELGLGIVRMHERESAHVHRLALRARACNAPCADEPVGRSFALRGMDSSRCRRARHRSDRTHPGPACWQGRTRSLQRPRRSCWGPSSGHISFRPPGRHGRPGFSTRAVSHGDDINGNDDHGCLFVPLARDAVIHAWDIARATRTDERLDPGLVDATLDLLSPTEMAAGRGTYAKPVEIDEGASPQQRLLAAVGRNPLPVV